VVYRLAALLRRVDEDRQVLLDPILAGELVEPSGRTVDSSARSSSATSALVMRSIVIDALRGTNRTCERFYPRSRSASSAQARTVSW
jgi:hypothetical protein